MEHQRSEQKAQPMMNTLLKKYTNDDDMAEETNVDHV